MIHPVYSSQEVLNLTYELTQKVANVEGDLIECGVAAGSQLAMMKKWVIDNNSTKKVFGYDSYKGIPFATIEDESQPGIGTIDQSKLGLLVTTGVSSHSKESVMLNFSNWNISLDNVELIEGWFEETIPLSNHKKISLLRLDGDLYSSTKVCMDFLFSKLQSGGILIIDDWELKGCQTAILEHIERKDIIETLGIAYYIKP